VALPCTLPCSSGCNNDGQCASHPPPPEGGGWSCWWSRPSLAVAAATTIDDAHPPPHQAVVWDNLVGGCGPPSHPPSWRQLQQQWMKATGRGGGFFFDSALPHKLNLQKWCHTEKNDKWRHTRLSLSSSKSRLLNTWEKLKYNYHPPTKHILVNNHPQTMLQVGHLTFWTCTTISQWAPTQNSQFSKTQGKLRSNVQ
jgi:hypothetical protein